MKTCGGEMLGSSVVEEMDPAEMFVGLATLIVEGRVPGGGRGYGEGPHCPPPAASACRHECDPRAFLCKRGENLRKHALLLWRSGVPLCVEVLLCPDCPCGAARASSPDVASPPPPAPTPTHSILSPTNNLPSANTPDLLLLEQWTLTVVHHRTQEGNAPGSKPVPGSAAMVGGGGRHHSLGLKGLFQAVRSQLHFSQLGAWWSSSGGRSPAHVVYRLSVPTGMLMASSFVRPPSVHHFPSAPLGRGTSTLEVSLSSLPRMESVPRLSCPIHMIADAWNDASTEKKDVVTVASTTTTMAMEEGQRSGKEESPSRGWSEAMSGLSGRRRPSCQRWNTKSSLPQADSGSHLPEPLLGESLLDPPPLERRGPVHGPGHLPPPPTSQRNPLPSTTASFLRDNPLFGKNISTIQMDQGGIGADAWTRLGCYPPSSRQSSPHLSDEQANANQTASMSRISRQGLARRRDLPALTTSLRLKGHGKASPPYPSVPFVVDDRMRMPCNRPGKHHCRHAEEDEDEREVVGGVGGNCGRGEQVVGGEGKGSAGGSGWREGGCKERVGGEEEGKGTIKKKKSPIPLSQTEVEEVLQDLRIRSTLRQRKRNGEEEGDSERGLSPLSASVMKGPIIPQIHNPLVYHQLTEEYRSSLIKTLPQSVKEKYYWKEERVPEDKLSHSETEAQTPDVAACLSSTKHCEAENGGDCQKNEQDKCETDNSSSVSPVRSGSSSLPCGRPVPSAKDKARFRKSLDSAASMVFHCRTGLPLTSSPAPIRRGTRFDFDSSLNSVSAIRSALFESGVRSEEAEEEAEPGSPPDTPPAPTILAPCPTAEKRPPAESLPATPKAPSESLFSSMTNGYSCTPRSARGPRPLLPSGAPSPTSASLLGSFEESVLNGRLEPVSTVQGFTAEIGASGPTGCPKHLFLPVTVFFYTLGDNDKVSTPYLSHINLGRKGYSVPRSGTVQVTLFNPLGTVVKMFVVLYDLADMPPLSQTFLRQRTLYVPASSSKDFSTPGSTEAHKWLRYLIHLRFSSSKSGRIYLHTDIRMIIFRKSDMDTATASSTCEESYELRSFTHGPTNPKFSPTK